jgi:hypothetical protein
VTMHQVGTGCPDCIDKTCAMNCSSATVATGTEWIAASLWAGVFPAKADAAQVAAWRATTCLWCKGKTWYSNFGPRGVEHEIPCAYCNPRGILKP